MILMTGERFDAKEAERVGLVNKVVPAAELDATVEKLTATLAVNAPLSLKTNKMTVKAVLQDAGDRDMGAIRAAMAGCFDSNDYREGRRAFMEKRKPAFTGT
jgi:enoyl-CoA hydratase/carnithine racemase